MDIEIIQTKQPWVLLSTMGMSGDWRRNSAGNKHARIAFLKANGEDLTLVDIRCFASFRIVTPEEAKLLESKIGHDLLKATMEKEKWKQLQFHSKIKDEEIKVALLTQNLFSGLGNIYVSETLYELGIDPRRIVAKLDPAKWEQINATAHSILQKAYKHGGSSIKDFTADGVTGHAQTFLKVYGRKFCPKNFKVQTIQQDGRTTWFVEEIQTA